MGLFWELHASESMGISVSEPPKPPEVPVTKQLRGVIIFPES
jgi:hypothetical protein